MNIKRLILAVIAVFLGTFATDYLIHGLWLEGDYTKTIDLWRSDPEIMRKFPWLFGSQLIVAILMAGIWALAFAQGAGVRRACLFGLMIGLLRQTGTLNNYAVQPIPESLALKLFLSGIAQSLLLAVILFIVYRPNQTVSPDQKSAGERRWLALAILAGLVVAGCWFFSANRTRDVALAPAITVLPESEASHSSLTATNFDILFSPLETSNGRGTPAAKAAFLEDLGRLDAQIRERIRQFEPRLKPLLETIYERQTKGKNVSLSLQIYRETRWWLNFTSDTNRIAARIEDLKRSLEDGRSQAFAQEQQPDGSWGPGYSQWFMKLYGTVHDGLTVRRKQKYPLSFLDRINSPEKLTNYMHSVVLDNFLTTGVVNRMEADESVSILGRLIMGSTDCGYPFHPQLKEAYLKFVDDWQNPETGCWGNWYVGRDGTVWRADDAGMTFHMVSRLQDRTKHLDKISRRILELSVFDFPAGLRTNGRYENHLNWDAVFIWKTAWPHLDAETQGAVRSEISRMLHWSLTESLQPDGSFQLSVIDDTFGDAMEFGVLFLRDVGLFEKSRRFWTDNEFPQAKEIHQRIRTRLESAGGQTPELERCYREIKRIQPD